MSDLQKKNAGEAAALRVEPGMVVGLGTGGPAAALFLARQGHDVEIFERVTDPGPLPSSGPLCESAISEVSIPP